MRTQWSFLLERTLSKFWPLPSLISILVMGLAFALLATDIKQVPIINAVLPKHPSSIEGARLILSSIATATMTVVGVLFSLTVVILQQVSNQYTPRVIENFIRSAPSQLVVGFYIGTFGYCLILLRMIRSGPEENNKVYELPITVASLLAIFCLGLLIYYLHHISKSIKSNHVLNAISKNSLKVLKNIQDDLNSCRKETNEDSENREYRFIHEIHSNSSGYLQEIEWREIPKILGKNSWETKIEVTPGDFVFNNQTVAHIKCNFKLESKLLNRVRETFHIGLLRTYTQDPRYGLRQMTDIGLRALSPGINDPATAVEAINEIGSVLLYFIKNCHHSGRIEFENRCVLQFCQVTYRDLLRQSLEPLLYSGKDFVMVLDRIEDVLLIHRSQSLFQNHGQDGEEMLLKTRTLRNQLALERANMTGLRLPKLSS